MIYELNGTVHLELSPALMFELSQLARQRAAENVSDLMSIELCNFSTFMRNEVERQYPADNSDLV